MSATTKFLTEAERQLLASIGSRRRPGDTARTARYDAQQLAICNRGRLPVQNVVVTVRNDNLDTAMRDLCEHRNPAESWLSDEQRRVVRYCVLEVTSRRNVRTMNDEALLREMFHFRAWGYVERADPLAEAVALAGALIHPRTLALKRLDKFHDAESLLAQLEQTLAAAALTIGCGERIVEVAVLAEAVTTIRTGYVFDAQTRAYMSRQPVLIPKHKPFERIAA